MDKEKQEPKTEESIFKDIHGMIEQAQDDVGTWASDKDTYHRLRMRIKKNKTFPFPGCANLRLPTIETIIRKLKSALVGIYANIKPRVQVVPQSSDDLQKAYRIERFLDWLADVKMMLLNKIILLADKVLDKGFCLLKISWRMEDVLRTETLSLEDLSLDEAMAVYDLNTSDEMLAEFIAKKVNVDMSESVMAENMEELARVVKEIRQGKDKVTVKFRDELYNAPYVEVVDPEYCYVPPDSRLDPQDCRFIAHEYYESYDTLKSKANKGIFSKETIDDIDYIKGMDVKKLTEVTKDLREGIERINNASHLVKIWDVYVYYDLDDDGEAEKCQFILAPDFKKILKKQRLPYDHQKFPFVRFDYEIIDDRWFSSRGITELLEDIVKEIDTQHAQKLDSQTIRNAPMFVFRSGVINPKLVKFIPAQAIPVNGMTPLQDALQILNNNNSSVEFSYEREQMLLETKVQEFIGQIDYSLQSMINKRQPRTLGEVQMQAAQANQVFSLDASVFANNLAEMFTQILQLCQQYMPERIFALVTGENGIEPLHLTRDEIQGRYHLVCRGNDQNTNPQVKLQKAIGRVQMLLSPIALQTGVVTPLNVFNIFKRYLQDDGELAWQELVSQPQPPPPPPPPPADVKIPYENLTPAEQSQVLAQQGIKPDIQGQYLQKQEELLNAASEIGGKESFGGD